VQGSTNDVCLFQVQHARTALDTLCPTHATLQVLHGKTSMHKLALQMGTGVAMIKNHII
jgi:hypothetical protein